MTTFVGSSGVVNVGVNGILEVTGFELTREVSIIPDSELTDAWESITFGRKKWSGTIDVMTDYGDTTGQEALTIGTEVALSLRPEGEVTGDVDLNGSAVIEREVLTVADDTIVTRRFEFRGTGALTQGTVT